MTGTKPPPSNNSTNSTSPSDVAPTARRTHTMMTRHLAKVTQMTEQPQPPRPTDSPNPPKRKARRLTTRGGVLKLLGYQTKVIPLNISLGMACHKHTPKARRHLTARLETNEEAAASESENESEDDPDETSMEEDEEATDSDDSGDSGYSDEEESSSEEDIEVPDELIEVYNETEYRYLRGLEAEERERLFQAEKEISLAEGAALPARFRILRCPDMHPSLKATLIRKMNSLAALDSGSGEYCKMQSYINAMCRLPVGRFHELPALEAEGPEGRRAALLRVRNTMDQYLYGQNEIKQQFLLAVARWMSNTTSQGLVLGIEGPTGVGKTTLIKECLSKSLQLPFAFIALGGANDSTFLDGHSFTYEGSTWGRIADALMSAKCMNPILCFDELDKVADNRRGGEIFNVLTHLTDTSQNDQFCDKYFSDIPLDLSRCMMVFTYNDASKIPKVLKDRMITMTAKPYTTTDKLEILQRHIIPQLETSFGFASGDIVFGRDVLERAIAACPGDGMRNVRRLVESAISHVNLERLMTTSEWAHPVCIDHAAFARYTKDVMGAIHGSDADICKVSHMYL